MIQLQYVSTATEPMSAAQLLAILQQCYGYNPLHDITGLLLYGNGTFLQALEGEDRVVTELYEKIARDARHSHVQCLSRETIETRRYPGWSMGFRRMARWENAEALRGFRQEHFTAEALAGDDAARDALMSRFGPARGDEAPPPDVGALERENRHLSEALRRAEGGIEIARLVLEDIAEAHASETFGDIQGRLCRFALGQINGI